MRGLLEKTAGHMLAMGCSYLEISHFVRKNDREEWAKWAKDNQDRVAFCAPDVEQNTLHEPEGKNAPQEVVARCRIRLHSRRHRLADEDGISGKAAIDGVRYSGLLRDDSTKFVESVTFTQEKIPMEQEESTEILIEEI